MSDSSCCDGDREIGGILVASRPSNSDYSRIHDWNTFCDDVDKILLSATKIYRIGIFVIYCVLLGGATLLAHGVSYGVFGNDSTFYILFGLMMGVTFLLYLFVMVRYNREMAHLGDLARQKSGDRVRYKLENERIMLCMRRYYIAVRSIH